MKDHQLQRETQSNGKLAKCVSVLANHPLQQLGQINSPQLLQLRRAFLENPSSSKSKMPIENYLANIDAYRYSTAKVGFRSPLLISRRDPRITKRLQEDQALRMLIITLLEEHKTESTDLDFVNLSKPSLIINVDVGDSVSTALWPAASLQLRKLVSSRGYHGVEVEIIDPKRHFLPSLFPIRPDDTLVREYESRRKGLITVIMKRLSTAWSTASLFKIGRDFSEATPAIVVMVRPKAHAHWWAIK